MSEEYNCEFLQGSKVWCSKIAELKQQLQTAKKSIRKLSTEQVDIACIKLANQDLRQQLQTAKEENEKLLADFSKYYQQSCMAALKNYNLTQQNKQLIEEISTIRLGVVGDIIPTLYGKPLEHWLEVEQQNKQMREALEKVASEQPEKYLSGQGWSYFHKFKKLAQQALNQLREG